MSPTTRRTSTGDDTLEQLKVREAQMTDREKKLKDKEKQVKVRIKELKAKENEGKAKENEQTDEESEVTDREDGVGHKCKLKHSVDKHRLGSGRTERSRSSRLWEVIDNKEQADWLLKVFRQDV